MRKYLLALTVLGAMTIPTMAQTPATGSQEVFWVLTLDVQPGKMDQFKQLVTEIVAAVEKEPGTLEYEWSASADQTTIDVVERYRDSKAVVQHVNDFGPFAKRFFAMVKPARFRVFGTPDDAAQKAIAGLKPEYLTTFAGFTR